MPAVTVAFAGLMSTGRNCRRATLPATCPHCDKVLSRKHGPGRITGCELKSASTMVKDVVFELVKGSRCTMLHCEATLSSKTMTAIETHILRSHDERTAVCGFDCGNGTRCQFSILSVDVSLRGNAMLRAHREVQHGWHGAAAHLVKRLTAKSSLIVGT